MAIFSGHKVYSSAQSDEVNAQLLSEGLSNSNVSQSDDSRLSVLVVAVGKTAGNVLHDLTNIGFNQYEGGLSNDFSESVKPEFSFIDAEFIGGSDTLLWHHKLENILKSPMLGVSYLNETEDVSWKRYDYEDKYQDTLKNSLIINNLDNESAKRLAEESAAREVEREFKRRVRNFIYNNNRFNKNQVVLFIYDVSDMSARRLIKPLLLSAKNNNVNTTFAISLQSYTPNLASTNPALHREMHRYARIGERYADYSQQFLGRVEKYRGNNPFVNDWLSANMSFDSNVGKIKNIIDVMLTLTSGSSLIAAEICDFNTIFKGYCSNGFALSAYEGDIVKPIDQVVEKIGNIHSSKPILHLLVNVVIGSLMSLQDIERINASFENQFGYVNILLYSHSDSVDPNKIQITVMSV